MPREGLLSGWLLVAVGATLLTGASLLPGRVLLPLTPDDFPAWGAGRDPRLLQHHPHPNWAMSDVLHLLVPGLGTTRDALRRGERPLWDPSQALGVPHIDQVHYGVYYPPAWVPLWLGFRGLGLLAWLHLMVAGGGMLFYLATLKRSTTACVTGALAFAFSAWMTARVHNFSAVGAAAWIPWVLFGLERGARGRALWPYAVAGLAVGLSVLAGFPQVTLLGLMVVGVLELARPVVSLVRRRPVLRPLLGGAAAALLGLLLAAPQLLPTLDYMRTESARAELRSEDLAAECLEPGLLAHLLAPDYYASASITGVHPIALGNLEQASNPVAVNRAETSMGIGAMGLLLALVTMLFGRTWASCVHALIVAGVFTLLLWPEAFMAVADLVPILRLGSPKRLLFVSTLCLSILAAGGVDLMVRQKLRITVTSWAFALALTTGALLLLMDVPSTSTTEEVDRWAETLPEGLGLPPMTAEEVFAIVPRRSFEDAADAATRSALLALAVAIAGVVVFRPRSMPTERGWSTRVEKMPWLLAALVGVEVVTAALPLTRTTSHEAVTPRARSLELHEPALVAAARLAREEDDPVPLRVARVGDDPPFLRPNFPGLFGLHDVQAYAPMVPRRTAELLEAAAPGLRMSGSRLGGFPDLDTLTLPLVDMLGVGVVFTSAPGEAAGFVESEAVGHVRVLRNTEALPRVFFADRPRVLEDGDERLLVLASREWNPWRQVVLHEAVDDLAAPAGLEEGEQERLVEAAARAAERARKAAAAAELGLELPGPQGADADGEGDDAEGDEGEGDEGEGDEGEGDEGEAEGAGEGPEDPEQDPPEDQPPERGPGGRSIQITRYGPGNVRVSVGSGPPGVLVLSETWHPGWRAFAGAAEMPVVPVNHALIGIPLVDKRSRDIRISFDPDLHGWPRWLAALGLLGVLVLLVPRRDQDLEPDVPRRPVQPEPSRDDDLLDERPVPRIVIRTPDDPEDEADGPSVGGGDPGPGSGRVTGGGEPRP